jgi:hypothetical protein
MTRLARRVPAPAWLLGLPLNLSACAGEPLTLGLTEPIAVESAQFVEGALPGSSPLSDEELVEGVSPVSPNITSYDLSNQLILPGEPAKSLRGRASSDALAVGVRIEGEGSGYWLIPTRLADPMNQNELGWDLRAAFNPGLTPGRRRLLLSAVGDGERSGTQTAIQLCIANPIPDNNNVCDPRRIPPELVVSLAWDVAADLDLRVVTPEGKVVDAKHPSTALPDEDGNIDASSVGVGRIDRDSNAGCRIDGLQRENLVFPSLPAPGNYLVYANLYDDCGQESVSFDVTYHVSTLGTEPDTFAVKRTFRQAGALQAVHANGGSALGMYVSNFVIP